MGVSALKKKKRSGAGGLARKKKKKAAVRDPILRILRLATPFLKSAIFLDF